jgi:hypothetical protein
MLGFEFSVHTVPKPLPIVLNFVQERDVLTPRQLCNDVSHNLHHASRQSGSCPILAALLIEVAAGTLDCSVVGLSPLPEQV